MSPDALPPELLDCILSYVPKGDGACLDFEKPGLRYFLLMFRVLRRYTVLQSPFLFDVMFTGVPHVEEASGGWTTPQNREDIMSASSPYRISGLTMLWMSFA